MSSDNSPEIPNFTFSFIAAVGVPKSLQKIF